MNQGVHTLALLLWFIGRSVKVSAEFALLAHVGVEVEDAAVATSKFDSGALVVLHATAAGGPGLTMRIQVLSDHGSAAIAHRTLTYILVAEGDGPAMGLQSRGTQVRRYDLSVGPEQEVDATQFTLGRICQYYDVIAAIGEGWPHPLSVDDAFLALRALHVVYPSTILGQKVRIDDVLAGDHDDLELTLASGDLLQFGGEGA